MIHTMKPGDLVRVKEFYRNEFDSDHFSIVIDVHEDDDGFLWYKVCPSDNALGTAEHWHPDYSLEMISEL